MPVGQFLVWLLTKAKFTYQSQLWREMCPLFLVLLWPHLLIFNVKLCCNWLKEEKNSGGHILKWGLLAEICFNKLHFKRSCFDHFQLSLILYLLFKETKGKSSGQTSFTLKSKQLALKKTIFNPPKIVSKFFFFNSLFYQATF